MLTLAQCHNVLTLLKDGGMLRTVACSSALHPPPCDDKDLSLGHGDV